MLFVELRFFVFFAAVFALVWTLRDNEWRKRILTAASYIFYAAWDWRFLALIVFVTLVSYGVGRVGAARAPGDVQRKLSLAGGIVVALGVLGVFKYFNFFADSFADLAGLVGLPAGQVTLNLVLPVGISFYTFQAISYMVDVHRGDVRARTSVLDVAFYIAFFPQLVAGPIVRASDFLPQMETARRWADVPVRASLALFLVGFIKKACISDNIAPYVDVIFADPSLYSGATVVGGVLLYGVQIYCDFSGYSDMAIACAALLGYTFPANFAAPYLSRDIQDFWRRWHISLSSWLRDYLYIPLGGNRLGEAAAQRQSDDDDGAGRAVARGVVQFRDLGLSPWARARRGANLEQARRLEGSGHGLDRRGDRLRGDVLLGESGLDLLSRADAGAIGRDRADLSDLDQRRRPDAAGGGLASALRAGRRACAGRALPGRGTFRRGRRTLVRARAGGDGGGGARFRSAGIPALHLLPILGRRNGPRAFLALTETRHGQGPSAG